MNENKFLNPTPEQVVVFPTPRRIRINPAQPERAYALFDSKTGAQAGDFIKGSDGEVEFDNLDPEKQYDVAALENIEDMGDKKPQFRINWTIPMRDDKDPSLTNSDNVPIIYPHEYVIKDNPSNPDGVLDLVDNDNNKIGQVTNLNPTDDKPQIHLIWSLKVKDDKK